MASKIVTVPAHLKCGECNNPVQIFRKRHRMKEKGHVKHMWCFKCKETTAHIELKEKDIYPHWSKLKDTEGEQLHG